MEDECMGLFDIFKKKDQTPEAENADATIQDPVAQETISDGEKTTDEQIAGLDPTLPDTMENIPEEKAEAEPVSVAVNEAVTEGTEEKLFEESAEKATEAIETSLEESAGKKEEEEHPEEHKQGFFKRLVAGLTKTRDQLTESLNQIFKGHSELDDDFYDELEEVLIMADLGLETTDKIIDDLKVRVKQYKIKEVEPCRELLNNIIRDQMMVDDSAYDFEDQKTVMLIIGVNGVGKTTSAVTMAGILAAEGKRVLLLDTDPHASLTACFGYDSDELDHTMLDLFTNNDYSYDTVKASVISTGEDNISIIGGSIALATLDKTLNRDRVTPES